MDGQKNKINYFNQEPRKNPERNFKLLQPAKWSQKTNLAKTTSSKLICYWQLIFFDNNHYDHIQIFVKMWQW